MDPTRRAVLGLALGWLLVVLVVGAGTFVAVAQAGRHVGAAAPSVLPLPATAPTGSTAPAAPTPTSSPSGTTRSPDAEPSGTPRASRPPGRTPAPTRSAPRATATRTARPPATTTVPPPAPTRRTASFPTDGGTVVASCAGATIRLDSITARDGWRFEEEHDSRTVHVHFEAAGEDREGAESESGAEDVELTVRCVDGVPTRVRS